MDVTKKKKREKAKLKGNNLNSYKYAKVFILI